MIISIDVEIAFGKIQHAFTIKVGERLELGEIPFNMIKGIDVKPTTNNILNGEKLEEIPLKSGMRQICELSSLLLNIVLEALARTIR